MLRLRLSDARVSLYVLLLAVTPAIAVAGPLRLDHRLTLDDDGPWQNRTQRAVATAARVAVGATALWEGADSRLGKTAWQAVDASVVGGVAAEGLKRVFSRQRPMLTDEPDNWFKGHSNRGFPSGETTIMAALVMPFILEYRHDYPAVYALEALPIFTAISRVKVHAHWQTDVLAGLALGSAVGFASHSSPVPVSVVILPRGITIGLKTRF